MSKASILKNIRNYAEYLRKKERGPVKAFFHITKNENVPAIEQQGLLTNHPNANVNSADHPFRKHGTDAGGVWVTTEPTAFPVYGTTIGGKGGNAAARADALSTFKIEIPLPELPKMRAVEEPYGKNILRRGDDPRAIRKFKTWADIDIPTTVFLDDIKPAWLKNIGYVEEAFPANDFATLPTLANMPSGWALPPQYNALRWLDKGRFKEYAGYTGHRHGGSSYDKSQQRFVDEYIDSNQPISKRLPQFPKPGPVSQMTDRQIPANISFGEDVVSGPFRANRYSVGFIPADKWTADYLSYVKPGESVANRQHTFAPGAISRGMGADLPSVRSRNFNWDKYKAIIERGKSPQIATNMAKPNAVLDWNNIVYQDGQYGPEVKWLEETYAPAGAVSRGFGNFYAIARSNLIDRRTNALILKQERKDAAEFLTSELGRQPTAEEIDNWTRKSIVDKIESREYKLPSSFEDWAYKADYGIVNRLKREIKGRQPSW